ncbi:hypothetical protein BFQ28_03210 [Citrobacter freundii]|uniref:hypothetical protein n=1 Tax=Citrobacter freundii TaxID=546 RepID=UPI000841BA3A|nr:hypothetical protein [Citrobacter freundii]AOI28889.1 hypothetical protein BFQ28_03210 [Citrobacter freundii]
MTALNKQARQVQRYTNYGVDMMEWADGGYVRHSDYLALLDELEAKDKSIGFLKDQLAQLANFNPDWDRLEAAIDSLREHMAKLSAAEKRIAELEARTVCLPKLPVLGSNAEWYEGFAAGASGMRNECADAIRAAGIGVKGE